LSDKPDYGYDFPTIASDIDNIVDALGFKDTPLTIIGHSWGAYITLYYAATRPTRVAKAVLLDGGTRPLNAVYATWEEAQVEMAPPEYNHTTLQEIKRRIYEDWLGAYFRPEHEPLALAMFDLSDPHNVHAHLSRENHMQIAYHLWSFHPLDYYIRVQCPVLIVNAIHPGQSMDSEMLTYTREAEIHLQRVEVFWMQDTIHDIPWHRPTELLGILQGFLPG
jgi:pimeloyl-ACP methyl ester carboxylesterase